MTARDEAVIARDEAVAARDEAVTARDDAEAKATHANKVVHHALKKASRVKRESQAITGKIGQSRDTAKTWQNRCEGLAGSKGINLRHHKWND